MTAFASTAAAAASSAALAASAGRLGDTPRRAVQILERGKQPLGEDGVRLSLETVARMAAEGQYDPEVRAWAIQAQRAAGIQNNSSVSERADALLRSFREALLWVDDPPNAEWMQSAASTLKKFGGGDCDDLTLAYLACLISLLSTSGWRVGVVGHAYNPASPSNIGHVLAAVWDPAEKAWLYADPSATEEEAPFGKFMVPPTRERVYDAVTGNLICDAEACLFGRGAYAGKAPPEIPGKADRIILSGFREVLPTSSKKPGVLGDAAMPQPSAVITDPATLSAWQDFLADSFDRLAYAISEARTAYGVLIQTATALGLTDLPQPPAAGGALSPSAPFSEVFSPRVGGWGPQQKAAWAHLNELGDAALDFLRGAVEGTRPVLLDDAPGVDDWALKSMPRDSVRFADAPNGALVLVPTDKGVTGLGAVAVGLIVVGGAAIYGAMFLMVRAAFSYAKEALERVTQIVHHQQYILCAKDQGTEACQRINEFVTRGHQQWLESEGKKRRDDNSDLLYGAVIVSGVALILGGSYVWYAKAQQKATVAKKEAA